MLSCVRMFANIKSYSNIAEAIAFIFQLFVVMLGKTWSIILLTTLKGLVV